MKIYILDESKEKLDIIKEYFEDDSIIFVQDEFAHFMQTNSVDCVVSPGNSFGIMDGGYDMAITAWFGEQLQNRVQQYILDDFYGEQPVGTSFIIKANDNGQSLIHTPSMRIPQKIKDETVIYQCMRSTLICAKQNNVKSIVIPLFGGGCGKVAPNVIAKMMNLAYIQINNPPQKLDWEYVEYVNMMLYVSKI